MYVYMWTTDMYVYMWTADIYGVQTHVDTKNAYMWILVMYIN